VIFLTAYVEDTLIERAKHVEPLGYIVKPFQEDQVRAAIEIAIYRNEMEKRLRKSEEQYRTIVNTAQEGIYLVDAEARINFVNRQMAEMLGYTVEEMLEQYLIDFMDDIAPVDVYETIHRGKEEIKQPHDFRFRRKDGSDLWGMITSSSMYDDKGEFAGALGMVVDVTERKRAERAVRKTNEELKNFIDVVSHDLKNPILSIRGFSTLLLRHYEEELEEKGRGYVRLIDASTRQMDRLVTDLLALSRVSQVTPNLKRVAFHDIVYKVASGLQGRLGEKEIELVVSTSLPKVYCDGERMHQVFENLLVNAVKSTGNVKRPKIEVGYEDKGENHLFYVRDNGIGIDPKYHHTVFEMFKRVNKSNEEEGTGLGLAIVERIVRQHGGKVWVDCEEGEGATFYFSVPK
jgi:PAS domain S-box-containing protein